MARQRNKSENVPCRRKSSSEDRTRLGRLLVIGATLFASASAIMAKRAVAGLAFTAAAPPASSSRWCLRGSTAVSSEFRIARRAEASATAIEEAAEQQDTPEGSKPKEEEGFLDGIGRSVGKSLVDAAVNTVSGMGENDRLKLLGKFMQGTSDFNDYLKFVLMMQRAGGAAGMMDTLSKMPGVGNSFKDMSDMDTDEIAEAEKTVSEYAGCIQAMAPDERDQPGFFLHSSSKESRLDRIAEESKLGRETVDRFMSEYKSVCDFFKRFGDKVNDGKSEKTVLKEMRQEMTDLDREQKEKEMAESAAVSSGGAVEKGAASKGGKAPILNPKRQAKKKQAKLLKDKKLNLKRR